jgi:hypothetical protein
MIAVVPDRKLVQPEWDPKTGNSDKLSVPISLVRSDGVIFPHDKENFTYCPEPEPSLYDQPETKRLRLDMNKVQGQSQVQSTGQSPSTLAVTSDQNGFGCSSSSVPLQINYSSSQINPTMADLESASSLGNYQQGGYSNNDMNQAYLTALYANPNLLAQMKKY